MQRSSRMVRHAMMMMAGTLVSRVLGLVREVVIASAFGATRSLDAFNVAYTLANLARQLVAEGALSAAFVPVFTHALEKSRERALFLARGAMTVLLACSSAIVLLGIWGAPLLTKVMAPGFEPAAAELATGLTRWMFPFLVVVSLAALSMGALNSLGSFFVPAVAPAVSNLTFIVTAPFFTARWGIYGLALSVLAGGTMLFLTQWLWGLKIGAAIVPAKPDLKDPDLRRMMALFIPYAAGLSLNQVNPIVSRMLGSFLQEGSISVLNYANRVLQLPLGLFVIAVSQAVLPQLSQGQSADEFAETLRHALRFALFIVLPASVGLILIGRPFVHLVFVRGQFGYWAWHATAVCLSLGMLGLPGMACSTVVMRGLYALSMPRAAFVTTLFSVASTALFSLALIFPMGYAGLALAPSLAFTLSGALGLWYLRHRLGQSIGLFDRSWLLKSLTALSLLALALAGWKFLLPYTPEASLGRRGIWCCGAIALGVTVYSAATLALRFPEWLWIAEAFARRGKKTGKI